MKRLAVLAVVMVALAVSSGCTSSSSSPQAIPKKASPELAARYNTQLAYGYMREGHMDIAQQKLATALQQAPHLAFVHNTLAFYYEQVGDKNRADQQYKLSLQYDPNDPNTFNNYGAFLCRNGEYRASLNYFSRAAADLNYNTPDAALVNAGICALKIPDQKLAQQYFQQSLAINSDSVQALWQLGLLFFEQGNYSAAHSYLAHLIDADPEVPAYVLWTSIEAAWSIGDRTDAQLYGGSLLKRFPDSPEAKKYVGLIGGGQ
ncbi:MAG: type IV pilus biogenesis/stability protein PilW [Gammaproteobacteria bacterium]